MSSHTRRLALPLAVLLALVCLVAFVPHTHATSNQEENQMMLKANDRIFPQTKELYAAAKAAVRNAYKKATESDEPVIPIIASAFTNTYLNFKQSMADDVARLQKIARECSSFFPPQGTTQCQRDHSLETEAGRKAIEYRSIFGKRNNYNIPKSSISMRMEPWFWADAARMAKLSRYAYTDFNHMNRDDVQVLHTWSGISDADAFMSVRRHRTIPEPRHSPGYTKLILLKREWDQYHKEQKYQEPGNKWNSMEADGAPASVEVVVRGTAGFWDIVVDLSADKLPLKVALASDPTKEIFLGYVHAGFYTQYLNLRGDVRKALLPFLPAIRSGKTLLYFSGHSLGGAVAQLLAMDIVTHFELKPIPYPRTEYNKDIASPTISAARVYTFGAPRVGTEKFANHLKAQLFHVRFKFMGDFVPEVPTRTMGFRHGDTYAIGLSMGSDGTITLLSPRFNYVPFCMSECNPLVTSWDIIKAFHAGDWAYQESIANIFWRYQKEYQMYSFGDSFGVNIVSLLGEKLLSGRYGEEIMNHLRCMGDSECVQRLDYPGSTLEQRMNCGKELNRQGITIDFAEIRQTISTFSGGSYIPPEQKVREALDKAWRFTSAFAKCIDPFVDKTYFKYLEPSDFIEAKGNYDKIQLRHDVNLRCHRKPECTKIMREILQSNPRNDPYSSLETVTWEQCAGDMECISKHASPQEEEMLPAL